MAEYLLSGKLKAEFDMSTYAEYGPQEFYIDPTKTECGSVGCVIGHATYVIDPKTPFESWFDYSIRVFGITGSCVCGDRWDWCFSSEWALIDNTPEGAGKRIMWLLERGLPDDAFDQIIGRAPLCYL